jgi:HAD superfamily hydrolase (TIGR01549 family)
MKYKKEVKKYKVIIFDLDGTLIDSLPYHFLSFKNLFKDKGVKVNEKFLKSIIGLSTNTILTRFKKKYHVNDDLIGLREERRYEYFKLLHGKDISFPGVYKALYNLGKKYRLAIATGSSRITFRHSTSKDIQKLFSAVVTIVDVKFGKPNPEPLLLVCKKLNVCPCDCLMIGDSIYDAKAAKRAKIDFIGVSTGYSSVKTLKKNGAIKVLNSAVFLEKYLKSKI